jgi:CheY-like chemotaxis protein
LRLLIVDDEQGHAAMLASAATGLGHECTTTSDVTEALRALQVGASDAVIIDVEMPGCTGPAFFDDMRALEIGVPAAFTAGACRNDALIAQCEVRAAVLPTVWTHADVRALVDGLAAEAIAIAQAGASGPADAFSGSTDDTLSMDRELLESTAARAQPPPAQPGAALSVGARVEAPAQIDPGPEGGAARRASEKVRIACKSWEQVERLCTDVRKGITTITVRAKVELEVGDPVLVSIGLPDEMALSVEGVVLATRPATGGGKKRPYQIDLVGLTSDQIFFMMTQCNTALRPKIEEEPLEAVEAEPGEPVITWSKPGES